MRESMTTAAVIKSLNQLRVMCCKLDDVAATDEQSKDLECLHDEAGYRLSQFEECFHVADGRDFALVRDIQRQLSEIALKLNVDIEYRVE